MTSYEVGKAKFDSTVGKERECICSCIFLGEFCSRNVLIVASILKEKLIPAS